MKRKVTIWRQDIHEDPREVDVLMSLWRAERVQTAFWQGKTAPARLNDYGIMLEVGALSHSTTYVILSYQHLPTMKAMQAEMTVQDAKAF